MKYNRLYHVSCVALSLVLLTSCVDREQADAQLVKGCTAAVNALLESDQPIDKIVKSTFATPEEGQGMRQVMLTTTLKDDASEMTSDYECVFEEDFGAFNMSYAASLYRVKVGDKTVGKVGNDIVGDAQEFTKIEDAVRGALSR